MTEAVGPRAAGCPWAYERLGERPGRTVGHLPVSNGSNDRSRALRDLRRARRRRAYGDLDWMDAFYKVYVTAIFSALVGGTLSGWIGGRPVSPAELAGALDRGPALIGLLVAVVVGGGLRSGGRGGPLALQPADVAHVLLAPVPRSLALRAPALRQLRSSAFLGTVAGMAAGNLAAQRLPGSYVGWVAWGGVAGLVTGLAWTGSALVASGFRLGRRWAGGLAILTVGWSAVDVVTEAVTSPATGLGRLSMSAAGWVPWSVIGVALLALPAAGLAGVGGTSLEATRRQAGLVAQLRFAVTMQDIRTVILLRRQLAAEGPRRRPWVRLPTGGRSAWPVWRRDWQGVLRWPAARLLRLVALGLMAGVAAAGAWRGTPSLLLATGAALLVAALDSVEGLAQEADHPLRRDTLPVLSRRLVVRHLVTPSAVMLAVVAVAVVGAMVVGDVSTVLVVGGIAAVPAALAAVGSAALSVGSDPVSPLDIELFAGTKLVIRSVAPAVLAVAGVLPVLAARASVDAGGTPAAGAAPAAAAVLAVMLAAVAWMRRPA